MKTIVLVILAVIACTTMVLDTTSAYGADLLGAALDNADLTGADLTRATWIDGSRWTGGSVGGSRQHDLG